MKKYIWIILIMLIILITSLLIIYNRRKVEEGNQIKKSAKEISVDDSEIHNLGDMSKESVKNNIKNDIVEKNITKEENKTMNNTIKNETIKNQEINTTVNSTKSTSSNSKGSLQNNIPKTTINTTPSKNETKEKENKETVEPKKEEIHKHFMMVNAGWFNTVDELENAVDKEFAKWDKKYENGEITWEELGKYCPIGYESFRCSCGKLGLEYSYE